MPSIRVKSSRYSTLREDPAPSFPSSSSVTAPFSSSSPDVDRVSPQSPAQQPSTRQGRARSRTIDSTASGRVQEYTQRRPLKRHTRDQDAEEELQLLRHSRSVAFGSSREELVASASASASGGDQQRVGEKAGLAKVERQASWDEMQGDGHGMQHHDDIVEHLDVIDPQVATISNLTNAANAILIPPFLFDSRTRPLVTLPQSPLLDVQQDVETGKRKSYDNELDQHVDDVLTKRARLRRIGKGIWSFLKTPMGVVTAIYGFCVVFWGAAIVLFLAKWIDLHNNDLQGFWVEVSCQVTNALFTLTGIGLIPSRILDTYRISKIIHYKRKTRRLRREAGLPALLDEDDLPDPVYDPEYVHVLTDKEQKDLHYQQDRFHHHQTWYRAHGTETHRAFPINHALLICLFNDGNSIFQILLCACMWGINRFLRPAWTTGSLIPLSFLCGIASAVLIAMGSSKTKRTEKVEKSMRDALDRSSEDNGPVEKSAGNGAILERVDEGVEGDGAEALRTSGHRPAAESKKSI